RRTKNEPRIITRERTTMKADRGAGAGHLRWRHHDLHRGGAVHVRGGLDVTTAAYHLRCIPPGRAEMDPCPPMSSPQNDFAPRGLIRFRPGTAGRKAAARSRLKRLLTARWHTRSGGGHSA